MLYLCFSICALIVCTITAALHYNREQKRFAAMKRDADDNR